MAYAGGGYDLEPGAASSIISVTHIRDFAGARMYRGTTVALFVTTAQNFSVDAKERARTAKMLLVGRGDLFDWIRGQPNRRLSQVFDRKIQDHEMGDESPSEANEEIVMDYKEHDAPDPDDDPGGASDPH